MAVKTFQPVILLILLAGCTNVVRCFDDPCTYIECEELHKCYLYEKDGITNAVCMPTIQEGKMMKAADNDHVRYQLTCPAKRVIGLFKERIDCGEMPPDTQCKEDTDCDNAVICCYDGCWKTCVKPLISQYQSKKVHGY